MKATDFDTAFDNEENILDKLDLTTTSRPALQQRRVNVDLPEWMISQLDQEAKLIGITRQSIIKVWLADRLQKAH